MLVTKFVVWLTPLKFTVDELMKLAPLTVSVKAPALALDGDRLVIVGTGLGFAAKGSTLPIAFPEFSVNQSVFVAPVSEGERLQSQTIICGPVLATGIVRSVTPPVVVIWPILLMFDSVNHSVSSGPLTIPIG